MAYPDYLTKGAVSLNGSSWEQSLGFADNAELVIEDAFGILEDLDRSADYTATTGGIHYLYFLGGTPIVGAQEGVLKVGFEGTSGSGGYTAGPNLIWATNGGVLHLEMDGSTTNHDAKDFRLIGKGPAYLHAGHVDDLFVGASQFCKCLTNMNVDARLVVSGAEARVHMVYHASDVIPSVLVGQKGGHVLLERNVSTEIKQAAGLVEFNVEATCPLWEVYGGTARPQAGTITQLDWLGGDLDFSATRRPTTISTLNNLSGKPIPRVPANVTITTISDNFEAILGSGGTSVPISR
jgi:hypothetical protein